MAEAEADFGIHEGTRERRKGEEGGTASLAGCAAWLHVVEFEFFGVESVK
jgi:hypothetical protein